MVTGGRQGCLLTSFLFLLIIDWVMRLVTEGKRTGIQWSLLSQLEDLDFADDIALLSHSPVSYTHLTLPTNREV